MKLVIAAIEGGSAEDTIHQLTLRGYVVLPVDEWSSPAPVVSIMVPVQDQYLPELLRQLGERVAQQPASLNPLLPFAEPAEYYVPGPIPAGTGGSAIFVVNLRRYERIG